MGRLVSNTSMTVDGLYDVDGWFVAEGDHDPQESTSLLPRLGS
jgi:hypothetical protein